VEIVVPVSVVDGVIEALRGLSENLADRIAFLDELKAGHPQFASVSDIDVSEPSVKGQ